MGMVVRLAGVDGGVGCFACLDAGDTLAVLLARLWALCSSGDDNDEMIGLIRRFSCRLILISRDSKQIVIFPLSRTI